MTLAVVTAWSAYHPADRFTWWLESFPILIGVPLLIVSREKLLLSGLVYLLLWLHALVLLVGAHYTYAEVPLFNWLRDEFQLSRNHYDKIGHFMQGFVPAMLARELLLKTSPLKPGKWLFAVICLSCLGISALYEILEWGVAAWTGEAAEAFLGTQGDVWDTQKDMAFALLGAVTALLTLGRLHDRRLNSSG